jgi:hypothetical protein
MKFLDEQNKVTVSLIQAPTICPDVVVGGLVTTNLS